MKKRIWMGSFLGTIAPLLSVVSCGIDPKMIKDTIKQVKDIINEIDELGPVTVTQFGKTKEDEKRIKELNEEGVKFDAKKLPIHKNTKTISRKWDLSIARVIYYLKKNLKLPRDGSQMTEFNYVEDFNKDNLENKKINFLQHTSTRLDESIYENFAIKVFNIPDLEDPTKLHIKFSIEDKIFPKFKAFFKFGTLTNINLANIKNKFGDKQEASIPNKAKRIIGEKISDLKNQFLNFKQFILSHKIIDPFTFEHLLGGLYRRLWENDEKDKVYKLFVKSPFIKVDLIQKLEKEDGTFRYDGVDVKNLDEWDELKNNIYCTIHSMYEYLYDYQGNIIETTISPNVTSII